MGKYCGEEGSWKSEFIPDEFWVPGAPAAAKFYRACIEHDDCYDTLGAGKAECDRKFRRDLKRECDRAYSGESSQPFLAPCYRTADLYYQAVRHGGDDAYRSAQVAAAVRALMDASGNMPPGYPTSKDFAEEVVRNHTADFNWHREPGDGGGDHGAEFLAPAGMVVVDFFIEVFASRLLAHPPSTGLVFADAEPLRRPIGVVTGARLEPEGVLGAGARYKGRIHMRIVAEADWQNVVGGG